MTVIAAGFDGGVPNKRTDERALGTIVSRSTAPAAARPATTATAAPAARVSPAPVNTPPVVIPAPAATPAPAAEPAAATPSVPVGPVRPPKQVVFDESDDLDVPEWLK